MQKCYILPLLFLTLSFSSMAQLTGITPNQGIHGQTMQTTITGSGIFIQASTPSGNIYEINLKQGANTIQIYQYWQWFGTTVMDPNTVISDWSIPLSAVAGVYDLEVITGDVFDPQWNQSFYSLPGAFTLLPPDGYISGTVYNDINQNGVKDIGEPGVANRYVKLVSLNLSVNTDANGDYNLPVQNGTHDVALLVNVNDNMYLTTPNDTFSVTINNNNSSGNDFGLKYALVSVTPHSGYKGVLTTHQIVSEEPIFVAGGGPNGNVNGFRVFSIPSIILNPSTSVTVIDSFTIQVALMIPGNTALGNNLNIRVSISSGPNYGYHYLNNQLDILAPPSYISGTMFFDQNQNKQLDTGEPGIRHAKTILTPDNSYAFADANGSFLLGSLGGIQTLTSVNNVPDLVLYTDSASYTFNATGNITGKDFGFLSTNPDYSILVFEPYIFPRCNSMQTCYFKVRNTSNIYYNATAWLKLDPLMNYVPSPLQPTPSGFSNDTLYWNINNLAPYSEIWIAVNLTLPGFGNTVVITTGAYSLDGNNVVQLFDYSENGFDVICGMDPNDKQVKPEGIFAQHFTLMSDTLEYLIRFQNTGNDTAFNVVILDTLDSDLDYSTFEILDNSHSMQTQLYNNGEAKFIFNNILLPDSNVNEAGSHGYVRYRIKAKTGLPDSTIVNNTGYIYFDLNPPVITNTTLNTLVYVLPSGIPELGNVNHALLYPNPFSESATLYFENQGSDKFSLSVSDITGKNILPARTTFGNSFVILKNGLSNGMYIYNLVNSKTNKRYVGKFIVE